jgi:cysteine-rich repeat protein
MTVAFLGQDLVIAKGAADTVPPTEKVVYLFDGRSGALLRSFANPIPSVAFGVSLAGVGSRLAVGAPSFNANVFVFDAGTGQLLRTVPSPAPGSNDQFGATLATLGQNVIVGAPQSMSAGVIVGAVYLLDPGTGAIIRTFADPSAGANTRFGTSVAVSGPNILVGNRAVVYLLDGNSGALLRTFTDPTGAGGGFGSGVAVVGTNVVISAPSATVAGATAAGAVYVFDGQSGAFLRSLNDPQPSTSGFFGTAIAAANRNVVVSKRINQRPFLFEPVSGAMIWSSGNPHDGADQFGSAIAATESSILVGGPGPTDGFAGAAYLFTNTCGDGVLNAGEQCDDRNTRDSDCCSGGCVQESSTVACDDSNACTGLGRCTGAGTCATGPCVVGMPCGAECGGAKKCQEQLTGACECVVVP